MDAGHEYLDALKQLVEGAYLEDPALGITRQVISKGELSLSEKQKWIFQKFVINEFFTKKLECSWCGQDFSFDDTTPFEELLFIRDEGMCSHCKYLLTDS